MKDLTSLKEYRLKKALLLSISFYGEDERYKRGISHPPQVLLPLV